MFRHFFLKQSSGCGPKIFYIKLTNLYGSQLEDYFMKKKPKHVAL